MGNVDGTEEMPVLSLDSNDWHIDYPRAREEDDMTSITEFPSHVVPTDRHGSNGISWAKCDYSEFVDRCGGHTKHSNRPSGDNEAPFEDHPPSEQIVAYS